ncbi:hypothetical protein [Treponema sp.]|uniref:hypothetical protein n=1 Tax=Treponema sp. TaxID=166 RepID=UPI00298D7156|nr:hypothetical protein [Treponema sp.]MCR5614526.1 hypothetical protein [Treponema sp.]
MKNIKTLLITLMAILFTAGCKKQIQAQVQTQVSEEQTQITEDQDCFEDNQESSADEEYYAETEEETDKDYDQDYTEESDEEYFTDISYHEGEDPGDDFFLNYISFDTNQQAKNYNETQADLDTLKHFYRSTGDMQLYGTNIWSEHNYSKDRVKEELCVYAQPDEKSEVKYRTSMPDYFKIVGIGKKDTLYGITSHWVNVVIPRFLWKSDKPEYGWVFGDALSFTDELYPTNYSYRISEENKEPWAFEYEPLNLSQEDFDSFFSSKKLYDVNENGESNYTRYLRYLSESGKSYIPDFLHIKYPEIQFEFIKSGVYPGSIHEKEIKPEFKIDYLYSHMLQAQNSLYPIYISGADNLLLHNDAEILTHVSLDYCKVKILKDNFEFRARYIFDSTIEHTEKVINNAVIYDLNDSSYLVMIYTVFINAGGAKQDQINVYKIQSESDGQSKKAKRIFAWKSKSLDCLSETRANIVFARNPFIRINKLNAFSEDETVEQDL